MRGQKVFKGAVAAAAFTASILTASAQTPSARPDRVVLRDFTLIDGTGRAPVRNAGMVVTDGRITWVGPARQLKAPAGAKTVRLAGKYVMPGIIDTHVHLGLVGSGDGLTVAAANQTRENVEAQLQQYAAYGVTTVQSMGTDQDIILQMRDAQRSTGRPSESRIFSAGLGVVVEGGYGGLAGVTKKVSTGPQATEAVNRELARNVDLVKFWLDDELGTMPKLPPEISGATITAAHAGKKKAVGHIFYYADALRITQQGIDGLGHAVRDRAVDAPFIQAMKQHHTWQMASTLAREEALFAYGQPNARLNDPFFKQSVSAATLAALGDPARQQRVSTAPHFNELEGFFKQAQRNLKALSQAGVPYAMGTDSGGPGRFPGYAEHSELQFMVDAGLTPMQAIVASTSSGARFLGAKDIGSLEAGKWADLVVLGADPLANIKNSRAIDAVYIAGRQVRSIKR